MITLYVCAGTGIAVMLLMGIMFFILWVIDQEERDEEKFL